jgi:hypothetical protein
MGGGVALYHPDLWDVAALEIGGVEVAVFVLLLVAGT